jgi:hypothetical protein
MQSATGLPTYVDYSHDPDHPAKMVQDSYMIMLILSISIIASCLVLWLDLVEGANPSKKMVVKRIHVS